MAVRKTITITTDTVTREFVNGKAASRYVHAAKGAGQSVSVTVRFDDIRRIPKEARRTYRRRHGLVVTA